MFGAHITKKNSLMVLLIEWIGAALASKGWAPFGDKVIVLKDEPNDQGQSFLMPTYTEAFQFAKKNTTLTLIVDMSDTKLYVSYASQHVGSGMTRMQSIADPSKTLITHENGRYIYRNYTLDPENSSKKQQEIFFKAWFNDLKNLVKPRIKINACAHCGEKPATLNCSECKRDFCSPECAAQAE
jgi:hypothetical protein